MRELCLVLVSRMRHRPIEDGQRRDALSLFSTFLEAHFTCKMRRNETLDSKKIFFVVLNRCEIRLDQTNQEQAIIKRKD